MLHQLAELVGMFTNARSRATMALEDSYTLIKQMAADSYEAEMMKDPDFRADMERAEREAAATSTLWQEAAQGLEIPQQQASQDNEMER
jgi:hypothetical protein